jgi:hypothetical protein
MKMPHRPFFPGSIELRPDIFGLHHLSLLAQAGESEDTKQKRAATVEAGVLAAFKAVAAHLGEVEARQLFKRILRRPKRGTGKMLAQDRDARLLKEYDAVAQRGESIAALARRLHAANSLKLGNTPGAIAAQIRKLVSERKTREHEAKKQARFWRMATRGEKTLLSGFVREK